MNTPITLAARLGQFAVCVILLVAAIALAVGMVAQRHRRRRDRAHAAKSPSRQMTTSMAGCAFQPEYETQSDLVNTQ